MPSKSNQAKSATRQGRGGFGTAAQPVGFTPFNKNLVIGNWTVPNDGTFTRIENIVMLMLLYDARNAALHQYKDKTIPPGTTVTLNYKSLNTMWRRFGLGRQRGGWERERMLSALENLSDLKFVCRRWYVSRKKVSRRTMKSETTKYMNDCRENGFPISREEAEANIKAKHEGTYRKMTMGCIESFTIDNDDGGRVSITLDATFLRVCNYGRFYVEAYLRDMIELPTLTAQRLLLVIKAFRKGQPLIWDIGRWAEITGLYDTNVSRWRDKFRKAVSAVQELRGGKIDFTDTKGVIKLIAHKASRRE